MDRYQQAIQQQDKQRIYELMRQGEPIPADLLPTIADVLEAKGKRGRPSKKFYGVHEQGFLKEFSRRVDYMNRYDELMELAELSQYRRNSIPDGGQSNGAGIS